MQIHQKMIAEEEFKVLKAEYLRNSQDSMQQTSKDRSICLLASVSMKPVEADDVAGTLDLHAVKSVQGEVLIGMLSCMYNTAFFLTLWPPERKGSHSDSVQRLNYTWTSE